MGLLLAFPGVLLPTSDPLFEQLSKNALRKAPTGDDVLEFTIY
jgi:hypothetical protein